jgi:transposase
MNKRESFSDLTCEEQVHMAERELSSFVSAVTKLYGAEQARLAAEDWLEEFELIDSALLSARRKWRAATIAASTRLADRLSPEQTLAKAS